MNACSISHLKIVSYKIPYIIYSLCSPIEKGKNKIKMHLEQVTTKSVLVMSRC